MRAETKMKRTCKTMERKDNVEKQPATIMDKKPNGKFQFKSLLVWAVLAAAPVLAQYQPVAGEAPSATAALTSQMLKTLEGAVPMTPQLRAVRDALAHNSIHSLAINPDVENRTDALFSHEIKDPGSIADQDKSGRCWLFAGLNMLRPGVIAKEKMKETTGHSVEATMRTIAGTARSMGVTVEGM